MYCLATNNADPKIRVRVTKKGVTLGDLTHYYTTPLEGIPLISIDSFSLYNALLTGVLMISATDREAACAKLEARWRQVLERRDHQETQRMLQEAHLSTSGMLLRSVYRRCSPSIPATGSLSAQFVSTGCSSTQLVRTYSDAELDGIRAVWDRNSEQVSLAIDHSPGWYRQ